MAVSSVEEAVSVCPDPFELVSLDATHRVPGNVPLRESCATSAVLASTITETASVVKLVAIDAHAIRPTATVPTEDSK